MTDPIDTSAEAMERDVLPKMREVRAAPDGSIRVSDHLDGEPKSTKPKSPAQWAYERLILYIRNFEKQLNPEEEVAMGFTGGDAGVLRIEGMGYFDPDLVTFYGSDMGGMKTQMIQHVSQLNVHLRALPRTVEAGAAERIGFRLSQTLEDEVTGAAESDSPADDSSKES